MKWVFRLATAILFSSRAFNWKKQRPIFTKNCVTQKKFHREWRFLFWWLFSDWPRHWVRHFNTIVLPENFLYIFLLELWKIFTPKFLKMVESIFIRNRIWTTQNAYPFSFHHEQYHKLLLEQCGYTLLLEFPSVTRMNGTHFTESCEEYSFDFR